MGEEIVFSLDNVVVLLGLMGAGIVWGMKLERRIDKLEKRVRVCEKDAPEEEEK